MSFIDTFDQVYRVVYDWQSSRTRIALNQVLGMVQVEFRFDESPRCANLLDGSAVLNWLTGEAALPPAPVGMGAAIQPEPRALLRGSADEGVVGSANTFVFNRRPPVVRRLAYSETLGLISWFVTILDRAIRGDDNVPIPGFRTAVETWYEDHPEFDPVGRLLRFTPALSLNRRGGTIRLPWFDAFEFSNEFVGWQLAASGDGEVPDPDELWPRPLVSPATDEPQGVYILTEEVVLHPGQALVGDGASLGLGFRNRYVGGTRKHGGLKDRLSLLVRSAVVSGGELRPQRQTCFPRPAPPFEARAVIRLTTDTERVGGVELRDLHIALDTEDGNFDPEDRAGRRLTSVINLDGAQGARVEHLLVEGRVRQALRCNDLNEEPESCHLKLRVTELPDSVVQFGVERATQGVIVRDCWFAVDFRLSVLRFGPQASQNVVLGGEVNSANGNIAATESSAVWWEAGSVGNWMLGGDMEPRLAFGRARYLMEGRGGAVESTRVEPVRNDFDMESEAVIACLGENSPFRRLDDVRQEPFAEVEITATGVDNALVWPQFNSGRIVDCGTGTFARAFDSNSDQNFTAIMSPNTWDNLLSNGHFALRRHLDGACGWETRGVSTWRRAELAGGVAAVVTSAEADFEVFQTLEVWGPTSIVHRADGGWDNFAGHRDRKGAQAGREIRRTGGPDMFEGAREYLASVRVAAPDRGAVTLRLTATGADGAPLATASATSNGVPGAEWLTAGLRTPVGTRAITWSLAGRTASLTIGAAGLVEGSQQPSDRLSPVYEGGGAMHGPLWLPGPTYLPVLRPNLPWLCPVESRVLEVYANSTGAQLPGPGRIEVWVLPQTEPEWRLATISWNGLAGRRVAQGEVARGRWRGAPTLAPGDQIHLGNVEVAGRGLDRWRVGLSLSQAV